jgi:peptidyl-prolyl cis-trans isomerase D
VIKLMREGAHRYPWIIKTIMGTLAVAFIITMGWWGFGETSTTAVASVGDEQISLDEYRRTYENTYRFYKDNVQGDFKEETLKQFVLEGLIENKLWTLAAHEMHLHVTADELRDDIMRRPEFQRNGKFDPEYYRQILAANRLTPAMFESMHTAELLREKARALVRDGVALTPGEISEAQSLMARQAPAEPNAQSANDRLLQDFLFQKQQRALMAFKEGLKAKTAIKVHKENI